MVFPCHKRHKIREHILHEKKIRNKYYLIFDRFNYGFLDIFNLIGTYQICNYRSGNQSILFLPI